MGNTQVPCSFCSPKPEGARWCRSGDSHHLSSGIAAELIPYETWEHTQESVLGVLNSTACMSAVISNSACLKRKFQPSHSYPKPAAPMTSPVSVLTTPSFQWRGPTPRSCPWLLYVCHASIIHQVAPWTQLSKHIQPLAASHCTSEPALLRYRRWTGWELPSPPASSRAAPSVSAQSPQSGSRNTLKKKSDRVTLLAHVCTGSPFLSGVQVLTCRPSVICQTIAFSHFCPFVAPGPTTLISLLSSEIQVHFLPP